MKYFRVISKAKYIHEYNLLNKVVYLINQETNIDTMSGGLTIQVLKKGDDDIKNKFTLFVKEVKLIKIGEDYDIY